MCKEETAVRELINEAPLTRMPAMVRTMVRRAWEARNWEAVIDSLAIGETQLDRPEIRLEVGSFGRGYTRVV